MVFLKQIQREDLLEETIQRNFDYVKREIADYFKSKTLNELEFLFNNPNTCVTPVLKLEEVSQDPLSLKEKLIVEINDKKLGVIKIPNFPFSIKKRKIEIKNQPPEVGQHTLEILKILGIEDNQIQDFVQKKIIKEIF